MRTTNVAFPLAISSLLGVLVACGDANPPPSTPGPAPTTPPSTTTTSSYVSRSVTTTASKPPPGSDPNVTNATSMAHALLKEKSADLRACYEKGLMTKSSLAGQMTVRFLLTPAGQATSVAKESSSLSDDDVEQCVIKTIINLSFPRFDGKAVTIVYPIEFQPSGAKPATTSR